MLIYTKFVFDRLRRPKIENLMTTDRGQQIGFDLKLRMGPRKEPGSRDMGQLISELGKHENAKLMSFRSGSSKPRCRMFPPRVSNLKAIRGSLGVAQVGHRLDLTYDDSILGSTQGRLNDWFQHSLIPPSPDQQQPHATRFHDHACFVLLSFVSRCTYLLSFRHSSLFTPSLAFSVYIQA